MMAGMEVDDGSTRVGSKRNYSRSGNAAGSGGGAGGRSHGQQVCRYWQEGRCVKGDDCQWLHPGNAGSTGRGNSAGSAKRSNNAHEYRDREARDPAGGWGYGGGGFTSGSNQGRPRNVSARWGRGGRGGRSGRGSHDQRDNRFQEGGRSHTPKQKPCSYWLKGNCMRGDTCNFLHAHTTAPDMEMTTVLNGHEKAVRAIVLPEAHAQLYTGSQDESVRVWDCTTGKCTNVAPMGGDVGALIFAKGWLFVGLPNEVKVINMATLQQANLSGPKGQVHALAVTDDGLLFAGTHFNAATNQFEPAASMSGHTGPVVTLMLIANRLYSGSMDSTIRVWEFATLQCVQALEGHTNVVMDLLCWDSFLLSCSLDGTIKIWSVNSSGQLELTFSHPEEENQSDSRNITLAGALKMCGCTDKAGKPVLLCSYNDNIVRLYDLPTFTERGQLFSREEVRALQVGLNNLVFSGDSRGDVKVWSWIDTHPEAVVN
uniref:C3H1-type domain-containing protein n=1 Tax=Physcomitrium patens TaxID=3218 RepID=A0A2K1KV77_PHYPA|nr:hypothetical protein PHYPA_004687 [Physcomitrium patens]